MQIDRTERTIHMNASLRVHAAVLFTQGNSLGKRQFYHMCTLDRPISAVCACMVCPVCAKQIN